MGRGAPAVLCPKGFEPPVDAGPDTRIGRGHYSVRAVSGVNANAAMADPIGSVSARPLVSPTAKAFVQEPRGLASVLPSQTDRSTSRGY